VVVPLRAVPVGHRQEVFHNDLREGDHLMKKVDGPAVRLVDATDAALAGVPAELAVTLVDIAGACREGLMAVAVEAGLAPQTPGARTPAPAPRWASPPTEHTNPSQSL
jgi:hypothetical protein